MTDRTEIEIKSKIGIIIPTRNDRPEMLEHLLTVQIPRQICKPDKIYLIDSNVIKPKNNVVDIAERFIEGVGQALKDGMDNIYILEDDDYYPDNYIVPFSGIHFTGIEKTLYYHIFRKRYIVIEHPKRSSLFCTAFSFIAGYDFRNYIIKHWAEFKYNRYIDIHLWEYAQENGYAVMFRKYANSNYPIGIKHGIGLCGGNAHGDYFHYNKIDYGYRFLEARIRPESFMFYMKLVNNAQRTD